MTIESAAMALLGGTLIGLAGAGLMLFNGKIAGVSGIVSGLLSRFTPDTLWKGAFVFGLLAGGVVLRLVYPATMASTLDRSLALIVVAGLLVGFGARLGSGCTSGHGICGLSRLSRRSLVAVGSFMGAAFLAATVVSRFFGGAL